ncbi:hypothetical protein HNR42_003605 [Deinobacterium chartae]|uniref:DUF4397 domain-containing protein n=1 Tax=Deinobacterium chartae TaxID=521158 RepID=A0A841I7F0_9DEIO|nr:DUF4397 domain-containing protein [Deinobacterium chartae]MBB6100139.1 hypothetical protein [Deinobacterium chartae]
MNAFRKLLGATALSLTLPLPIASAQSHPAAAEVYFTSGTGSVGVVNVYIDGRLAFENIFPSDASRFSVALAPGSHEVVVTPNYRALGNGDLYRTTITVPSSGSYTLRLDNATNADSADIGLVLDLGTVH